MKQMRARGSALTVVWALVLAVGCALSMPAAAQEEATGTSYVNPFPVSYTHLTLPTNREV